ncbi:MAG: helix-turn-helix transcriptional regulator [Rhodospirillaceae bacterium]|jgi:ArsR family transcriptional regulator, virulence genes transcriptional regulator|nr:helix-turn-helix transcriptional regulator [Rhodospirillaceae bacterium]MBT4045182.1 helix-turn-helix transcriptional regulator [Rhodospirillaceae bacterium]MBT4490549.1 helix-turn-helix transcriptional regulator [Rhodospirillaceae bacterium]MBT5191684.1 helix-turn-helix transcriptional regulator [Rhodospirillaceae bacterium]MBT5895034.1 helix-turn-helix transcriptional regulator [Rhodospirillaceae bacterium]
MIPDGLQDHVRDASRILKAMANERRFTILCHLVDGELGVGELEKLLGISQSALSQHLARLRNDGLVIPRRSAQNIYYSLHGDEARAIMRLLRELIGADGSGRDIQQSA